MVQAFDGAAVFVDAEVIQVAEIVLKNGGNSGS